jgi:sigma-B regulation protein RsbU (phosphoserine phosphatase)
MNATLRSKAKKWLIFATATTLFLNGLGATLMFLYFTCIESELVHTSGHADLQDRVAFFLTRAAVIMTAVTALGFKFRRSIIKKLSGPSDGFHREKLASLVSDLMSLPYNMALLSAVGWLAGVVLFGFLPLLVNDPRVQLWKLGTHTIIGILFVGGPFTVTSVYFVLEWKLAQKILGAIPTESLLAAPRSRGVSVLTKMMVVSIMMGIVPVSIVSYITLSQIHEIQAGRQQISSFVSQMPQVISFFLLIAVAVAVVLSVLLARSVSGPLRRTASAMDSVREGNLDVHVPVVSNDEVGSMGEGFNRMVEGLRERDFIRDTFGCYLSPDVVSSIMRSPNGMNLGGELREVTILISDLRGFTSLTATLGPEVVLKIVNRYLEVMVDIIMRFGGTIDEFTGDGILAFFGAPRRMKDSQERCVLCALEMQKSMPDLNRRLGEMFPSGSEEPLLRMGIAISNGALIVGNIGSEKRKKYGAIGTAINIAFRMEKHAKPGDILVTQDVYEKVLGAVDAQPMPDVEIKGIDDPITLYRVIGPSPTSAAKERLYSAQGA